MLNLQRGNLDFSNAILAARAERLLRETQVAFPAPKAPPNGEWPPDYGAVRAWQRAQIARFELEPELIDDARSFYREHPVEFINHWGYTYDPRNQVKGLPVWMPMILFQKQVELVNFCYECLQGEASGLVEKSRDMGATWVCVGFSVWLWLFHGLVTIGWGSAKREKVDRIGVPDTVIEKARMFIRALPKYFQPQAFNENVHLGYMRLLNPETGGTIIGEVGDNIGRGSRTLIYFVDEAAHLMHPEKVEASLLETSRTRIDVSSVSGLGTVFHRKREAGQMWTPGTEIVKDKTNVFVMDVRDNPIKKPAEVDAQRTRMKNSGLAHIVAREIDRDYAAAVEGVIIQSSWVEAAIDADKKLGLSRDEVLEGRWSAGLDVADMGIDRNSLAVRKGIVLSQLHDWSERDPGVTCRRTLEVLRPLVLHEDDPYSQKIELQYDCIGIGVGVKTEANRLKDDGLWPPNIILVPWHAGAKVLNPAERLVKGDRNSPTNKDYFHNFRAQAWYHVGRMFENTYRAVNQEPDFSWDVDDLIVIPSHLPLLRQLQKELSQATMGTSTRLKMIVNKQPEGTKSPNLADAVVETFYPWTRPTHGTVSTFGPMIVTEEGDV